MRVRRRCSDAATDDAGVLNRVEVEQGRDVLRRGDPLDGEVLSGGVVALTLDVCFPCVGAGGGRGAWVFEGREVPPEPLVTANDPASPRSDGDQPFLLQEL